ncbi:hypothetical protein NL476_28490, partial [Klebsiella pneumoniae]|nr:hypothetical protein [Klebsiella pneumoniae]
KELEGLKAQLSACFSGRLSLAEQTKQEMDKSFITSSEMKAAHTGKDVSGLKRSWVQGQLENH